MPIPDRAGEVGGMGEWDDEGALKRVEVPFGLVLFVVGNVCCLNTDVGSAEESGDDDVRSMGASE